MTCVPLLLAAVVCLALAGCQSVEQDGSQAAPGGPVRWDNDGKPLALTTSGLPLPGRSTSSSGFVVNGGEIAGTRTPGKPQMPGEPVVLNLSGIPIAQAAQAVLGDTLGAPYSVDAGLEGKITVQTPRPVPPDEAIQLFDAALRGSGAALQAQDGFYRVVPLEQAAQGAVLRSEAVKGGIGGGMTTEVIALRYVSAAELKRILEPIAPRGAVINVDPAHNRLTLTASSGDLDTLRDAIALFDVDALRGMSFAMVPVRSGQPESVAEELRTVLGIDRSGPSAGMIQVIPNRRLGAVLVMSPQPAYVQRAQDWIKRFERQAQLSEKQLFTFVVQNRRASELIGILQTMFPVELGQGGQQQLSARSVAPRFEEATAQSGGGGSGAFTAGQGTPAPPAAEATQPALGSRIAAPLSNDGPLPASGGAQTGIEPRMRIALDDPNNSIIIQASREDYKRITRVLWTLDAVPSQVLIEATIAEVSLTDDIKFGVRWFFQQNNGSSYTFTDAASGSVASVFPGFSYALRLNNVISSLNALNTITQVNIISSPSLMVLDNKTAVLQIGDQVPITTQQSISVQGAGSPIVNSVSYKDTGVILSVTPRISDAGRILLNIEQEVSSVRPTTSSGIDSPTIRQRRIKSNVLVNDGEALVLGGLMQDQQSTNRDQIPVLGDIPLIGNAFKKKTNGLEKTELVIIITPRVARDLNEARYITDEFRRRFSSENIGWPNIAQSIKRTLN